MTSDVQSISFIICVKKKNCHIRSFKIILNQACISSASSNYCAIGYIIYFQRKCKKKKTVDLKMAGVFAHHKKNIQYFLNIVHKCLAQKSTENV